MPRSRSHIMTLSGVALLVAFQHDGSDPRFESGDLQNHTIKGQTALRAEYDATPATIPNPAYVALDAEIDNPNFDAQSPEGPYNLARIPNPALETTPQGITNPARTAIEDRIFAQAEAELEAIENPQPAAP